jgi:hypothetical protein
MRDLGYIEGANITVEYRYAEGNSQKLPGLAAELVRLKVALLSPIPPLALSPPSEPQQVFLSS